ncbi:hypothetical protein ENUP19_0160G0028 [Entamoeba nuttalli]|uniref:Tetratricopeptide repeat-containing protein n=2 Tax=Entamoeba nuttalli TaxID=412467 RepID=K2GFI5_ENTNP|nr:tetratricopeptide repeat-containing protein [Entamoeba nuttalli P19]EKE41451.1 tetratricopeptide repeat-containing protein [Entamoeba nuttalli P19]|eukprot:XP_008856214.1 tetratricopeptide repeat-containing protein [Entamoeba nuttalli P19]
MDKDYRETLWGMEEDHSLNQSDSDDFRDILSDHSTSIDDEDDSIDNSKPKTRKLPDAVKKLIGEASMCYVKKEYSQATEYALEAIKIAPQIPDSYHTLGMIYLDLGDTKTAREYFMIAAHMKRTDAELWKRLADMFKEDGDMEQYYYCLSQAVLHDSKNVELLCERIEIGKKMEDSRGVLMTFQYLISLDGSPNTAKQIVSALISEKRMKDASSVVLGAIKQRMKENKSIDLGLANVCMELLLGINKLETFQEFVKEYFKFAGINDENIPIDMKVNCCLCNIRLGQKEESQKCIEMMIQSTTAENVDLSLYIANELMKVKEYERALELFEVIRKVDGQDNAMNWGNCAICLFNLGKKEIGIELAEKAYPEISFRGDITILLMRQYYKKKQYQKVLEVSENYFLSLEQGINDSVFDSLEEQENVVEILRLKMKANYGLERYEECYESFLWLFGKLLQKEELDLIRSRIKLFRFTKNKKWRKGAVLNLLGIDLPEEDKEITKRIVDVEKDENRLFQTRRKRRKGTESNQGSIITITPPMPKDGLVWEKQGEDEDNKKKEDNKTEEINEFTEINQIERKTRNVDRDNKTVIEVAGVFVLLEEVIGIRKIKKYIIYHINCSAHLGLMEECKNTLETLIGLYRSDEEIETYLRISYINIAIANQYYDGAIFQLKSLGLLLPKRKDIWYYFNKVIVLSKRQTNPTLLKYFTRMHQKCPNERIITVILGNLFLTTCQYNKALQQYLSVYEEEKESAVLNLSIAMAYLGDVPNRNTMDKSIAFANTLTFMKRYLMLGHSKKECYFNVGRMYHQLDISYLALYYYEQALSVLPNDQNESLLDREIAYNLSLMYYKSGNKNLCIKVRHKYLLF